MTEAAERFYPALKLGATGRVIVTPFEYMTSGEEGLLVEIANRATGAIVTVSGRFLRMDTAQIEAFQHTYTPTSTATTQYAIEPLSPGYLLNLTISRLNISAGQPPTWVRAIVARGTPRKLGVTYDPAVPLGVLAAGYVTARSWLAWPGSPIQNPDQHSGDIRSFTGTAPAAGAEATAQVPVGSVWTLRAFAISFLPSAIVATRYPRLVATLGGAVMFDLPSPRTQTASSGGLHYWVDGVAPLPVTDPVVGVMSFPRDLRLPPSTILSTLTGNLSAGDQYGAPQLTIQDAIAP